MFRESNHIYRRLNIVADALLTAFAYTLSLYIAGYVYDGFFRVPKYAEGQEWLFYVVVILWPILLTLNGIYPTNRLRSLSSTVKIIAHTSIQGLAVLFSILFLLKYHGVGRLILVDFVAIAAILLIIKEDIIRIYLQSLRKSGGNVRNVLVVGEPESLRYIATKIESGKSLGLRLMGFLVPDEETVGQELWGHEVLGSFYDIEKILHENLIDNVIVAAHILPHYEAIENIISKCEDEGVEVWLPARIFHTKIMKPEGDEFMDMPMFVFRTEPKFTWELLAKMVIDRVLGLAFGILTLPIVIIAAFFIKLTSPGPAIFKQERCGYHGRIFTLYKLRTMSKDAEITKTELLDKNVMQGPIFKMARDPRITLLGRFLRKTSIDELPQFWNAIKGDMSLVGPRPPTPEEVGKYEGWHRRRLSMKPGITGLLQVSGRSEITDFDKWVNLDLDYIDNWSLWLDIKILFKTIFAVLSTRGAK